MFRIRLLLGAKPGSNIAHSFKLGRGIRRALGLAQDTGSEGFLWFIPAWKN
jgi:hypothetical protein